MAATAAHPIIYEIHTWAWLDELSRRYGRPIHLGIVPSGEWDALAERGIDALWLMGVWTRSPVGIRIAAQNKDLLADFRRALPDFTPQDNVGSPYCIRRYRVDAHIGGPEGLKEARRRLEARNIGLILDFVPNHVAPDHDWVEEHPEYFIRGDEQDLNREPDSYMPLKNGIFACGRDPHYPAWPDVFQLNVFCPEARQAMDNVLMDIAEQCDGIRCDMAMLVLNSVFSMTWGPRAGETPAKDFWPGLIETVRRRHPSFLFLAEVYWELEWQLQQQGFDFCYDKKLYDRLLQGTAESVRLHLCAERSYQDKLIRFIENHDEPRAAAIFPPGKAHAAALTAATLPGARLFHEGQLEGKRVRLPVFLGRRPDESVETSAKEFYDTLFDILKDDCLRNGRWQLCECIGRPHDDEQLVAWSWQNSRHTYLVIVNLSGMPAPGTVRLPRQDRTDGVRFLTDSFTGSVHGLRHGEISVDLPAWGFHVLKGG